jgi:chitinase
MLTAMQTFYLYMQKAIVQCYLLLLFVTPLAWAGPDRVVLGYSASWRDDATPPECYNFDAITYLARAFLTPRPDGTIVVPEGYFNEAIVPLARQHGVKLLMSLGGEADNADNWLSIARNPKYLARFEDGLSDLLNEHGYDGIDIDWEPSALTTEDGDAFVALLKSLRARFPQRVITTALGASEYWVGHFSWKAVTDSVDYVNVMTYDYSGGWGGRAAYCSNLFPAGAYSPEPTLSVAEGMQNLIENHKVSPSKLLLGVTFWPSRFSVDHVGDRFPVNGPGYSMNIGYAEAMCLLNSGKYMDFWDEKAAMPYMERKAGGSVVCYESPESIRRKCQYAAKLGCAGVMIWHLGADVYGESAPLMDAVAESCGVAKQKLSREVVEREVADLRKEISNFKSQKQGIVDSGEDRTLSDDQLKARLTELQSDWALGQDAEWKQDAPQGKGK